MDTRTFPLKKLDKEPGKPIRKGSKYLVDAIGKNWATALVLIGVIAFTWKIFRCGGRTNLTAFGWLIEHTTFGSPVQYVPEEEYSKELEGTWLDAEGNLRW